MSNKHAVAQTRAQWRAQRVEEVLTPQQKICDAHHHLWDHAGDRYFAAELAADLSDGHNVVKTIYVECGHAYRKTGPAHLASIGETEFVVRENERLRETLGHGAIAGIIGFADLRLGLLLDETLTAHIEAGAGRFCGIRHGTAWDESSQIVNHQLGPPAGLMGDPSFVAGVQKLGTRSLTFDAWLYHPKIPEITVLAHAAPDTTIVLDHLGAPLGIGPYVGRREEVLQFCRMALSAFAKAPNARLKIGGIGMTIFGNGWHKLDAPPDSATIAAAWADHIRWCIDTFGPDRVLFESNFPPDGRSCSYRTLWNAYKRIAEPYSAVEVERMFHDNAVEVYRLSH